jgi:hypothetical protein
MDKIKKKKKEESCPVALTGNTSEEKQT